jgi:hypothetical protein
MNALRLIACGFCAAIALLGVLFACTADAEITDGVACKRMERSGAAVYRCEWFPGEVCYVGQTSQGFIDCIEKEPRP